MLLERRQGYGLQWETGVLIRGKIRTFAATNRSKEMLTKSNEIRHRFTAAEYRREVKALLRLGAPILLTQVGIVVVSFADTMMVGHYGTAELAAAAFVNNFFMVPIVMLIGFASGLTPLIGALFTRKENFEVGHTLRLGMMLNAAVAAVMLVVMGVLYFFIDKMGQPPELLPLIKPYYLIVMLSMVPAPLFNACQQTANAVTDTVRPMYIILIANVLNIIGNYLLIYGAFGFPELGLNGAGISTVLARVFSAVAMVGVIWRGKRYAPYNEGLRRGRWSADGAKRIFSTSLPVMVQNGCEVTCWAFGAVVCGWFGKIELAAFQVTNTMSNLGFMSYLSFAIAVSIRVANYMGLRDGNGLRAAARAGLMLNFAMSIVASTMFITASSAILRMFTSDEAVIATALLLILPLVLYQIFDALQVTLSNVVRGTSHVWPLLWVSLLCYVVVGLPTMVWFARGLGGQSVGVYYSFVVLLVLACVLYGWFFRTLVGKVERNFRRPNRD